jgi:hypothetical protein
VDKVDGFEEDEFVDPEAYQITFREIVEADIQALTSVMTRAFNDDAQKHLGVESGGPEGYDNGDFFRTWLFSTKRA